MGYKGKKVERKLLTWSKIHGLIKSSLNKKASRKLEKKPKSKFGEKLY